MKYEQNHNDLHSWNWKELLLIVLLVAVSCTIVAVLIDQHVMKVIPGEFRETPTPIGSPTK